MVTERAEEEQQAGAGGDLALVLSSRLDEAPDQTLAVLDGQLEQISVESLIFTDQTELVEDQNQPLLPVRGS